VSEERRLVVVLGYSEASETGLHRVCAARLARAAAEARPTDTVLLSGWARGRAHDSEADLMARAWSGHGADVLVDRAARSTYGNVAGTAAAARALAVGEVVLVTSSWHGRRAATLLRTALRGSGRRVTVATTGEAGALRSRLRELACWTLVPLQAILVSRAR